MPHFARAVSSRWFSSSATPVCLAAASLSTACFAGSGIGCSTPGCRADLNGDSFVGSDDLVIVLSNWGPANPGDCGELTDDAHIDAQDLVVVLRSWGPCPQLCPIDLDVDTDRDGSINDLDEDGEEKWKRNRGAFFLVNCDDDDKDKKADAAEYDADEKVVIVDTIINPNGDVDDITPLVVGAVGDLTNQRVLLKVGALDQIKAVHVFEKIAANTAKFWGGPTETDTEIDITAYLSETESTTLGIEGLKYRLVAGGVAGFTADMLFDGFVEFEVECRDFEDNVLGSDRVLLKVAPWMGLPNTTDSEVVFARTFDRGVPAAGAGGWVLLATPNDKFIEDLASGLPANQPKTFTTDTQWAQDDLEIGFSRTPRSEVRVAAYTRHHDSNEAPAGGLGDAAWRRDLLMGPGAVAANVGHYRNPRDGDDSGDYGGNIEVMPPTATHQLGRMCLGDTISDKKRQFFESQEVQSPFTIDTTWLIVGHVDEVVTFRKETPLTVIVASPKLAYDTLGFGGGFPVVPFQGDEGEEKPPADWTTFHSIGDSTHGIAEEASLNTIVDHDANFLSPPVPWRFVRIYDGSGAGQIAEIVAIPDPHTLVIGTVWGDFAMIDPIIAPPEDGVARASQNALSYFAPESQGWHVGLIPDGSSHYVVVEDTHWWDAPVVTIAGLVFPLNKTPATITRKEFDPTVAGSKGERMKTLNIEAQSHINDMRAAIVAAAGGAAVTFVEVPVLYTGRLDATDSIVDRTAVAWTPGAANILVANGKLFVPAQKGPRFRPPGGVETKPFDSVISTALGAEDTIFVEDFDHYHALSGEVHCGTNTLRKSFGFPWWTRQPASVPNLP